ncbi:MAG: DinB family protein [Pyrinomonadaceae bacterium]
MSKNRTVGELYFANAKARDRLTESLQTISEAETSVLPDGEKWTIKEIAEHISIVEEGMLRICSKLLDASQTDESLSDGTLTFSERFREGVEELSKIKVEAPSMVVPTGNVSTGASVAKLNENQKRLEELRPRFEEFDSTAEKFSHPFLGPLSAAEWLALIGGHAARHTKQIERLLEKIRT